MNKKVIKEQSEIDGGDTFMIKVDGLEYLSFKELCDAYNIEFKELLKIKRNNPEYSEMEILSHFFQRVIYSMRDGSYLVSDKKDL